MIGRGVPPVVRNPIHATASKSGYPDSIIVGTFGVLAKRLRPVEASSRIWPLFTYCSTLPGTKNAVCTLPPRMSVTAGAEPLYGTCTMSTPAAVFSISMVRCDALPTAIDA